MVDLNAVIQSLRRLGVLQRRKDITDRYEPGQPLRSELFSLELLERHAKTLAGWHQIDVKPGKDLLLPRLKENEEILLSVYNLVTDASEKNLRTAPAAAWLLDNFYRIEEQIRISRKHLPKSYSRELPHLVRGPLAGFPRVYDITRELIIHSDGRVDAENLNRFVAAYQEIKTLRLGELWAIPIMLRLGLIENIRRISLGIASSRVDRDLATYWADRLIQSAESDPKSIITVLAGLAESDPPISGAFVSELARRLQGQSPALALPLQWLDQRLSETGLTMDQIIQTEIQKEAEDRVSIGNSMESFRFLEAMDWRRFVETMSSVEKVLSSDPAGVYSMMDFSTRDRYRHIVEKTAKRSDLSEEDVAKVAVSMAGRAPAGERSRHVGYYLVDRGRPDFEIQAGMRPTPEMRLGLKMSNLLIYYLGSIALITAAVSFALLAYAERLGLRGWLAVPAGLLLVICVSSLAIAVVNCLTSLVIKPQALPRMDLSEEIPADLSTLVAIPTLLRDENKVSDLLNDLEVQYLANQRENLYFCLLTDLPDADQDVLPGDERLVLLAQEGIIALNKKYQKKFFLFHRSRSWNPQNGIWMGYERKRGILEDLNATLRGDKDKFSLIVGDGSVLLGIKYVITLDADTRMPRGSASLLIGTMAHILNHPVYDEIRQCVIDGYSILHPRLGVSLPEANRSRFVKLFGGDPGLDPYTREVSDVYQDLFHEGSFAGKGIYDVDAFSRSLSGRFPENLILSHDLLEGCYARAGLVSDVQFYEEYPYRYTADVSRRHRWIRGDWQIATWLLSKVPGPGALRLVNPLSRLSRWKILDNLRRSLVPGAAVLLLLLGWTALPAPWFWTLAVVGIALVPPLFTSAMSAIRKPDDMPIILHLDSSAKAVGRNLAQVALGLIFLPYEAFFSLDAVLRTWFRVLVTHRRLLEWNTASETIFSSRGDLQGFYLSMWFSPAIAAMAFAYLAARRPDALYSAIALLILWFVSPAVAWWISLPLRPCAAKLTPDQSEFLHRLSRRTWRFFETLVGPDTNWLPPDNYQEYPRSVVANGTSPTNMGLSLLACLSAYDFGYISAGRMMDRLQKAMGTMEGLEKHKTHFYNWYDIKLLEPLQPRYISTVDSGNLAGHLLVLHQGLMEIPFREILRPSAFSGLRDTLMVILDEARGAVKQDGEETHASERPEVVSALEDLKRDLDAPPSALSAAWLLLDQHTRAISDIADRLDHNASTDLAWWIEAYETQLRDLSDDLTLMAPWLMLPLWAALHPAGEEVWRCSTADQARMLIGLREELLGLDRMPQLQEVPLMSARLIPLIDQVMSCLSEGQGDEREWFMQLREFIVQAGDRARGRMDSLRVLAEKCLRMADMEYAFLFNDSRQLLAIGYNVNDMRRDESCYDLLASEARLTSFLAIAQGKLRQEHWFALGRQLTTAGGELALLSWGGTMFEYLMPALVMPIYENTLLDQTYKAVVRRQVEYGSQRNVPWGVSESGYNMTDMNLIYQYRAFGVPGLGFKRGLAEDLVIAPYASTLALMVEPARACSNLQIMADDGYLGDYGFFEAIDYTPSRLARDQESAVVRSFMSHHQGMSFLSLAYLLLDRPMQRRFGSVPIFQAVDLLLQEKVPKAAPFYPHAAEVSAPLWRAGMKEALPPVRFFASPNTPSPEVHLLSNGRYSVMVTNSGSGYSIWNGQALTRWHRDPTRDDQGMFIYLRDVESGSTWSAGYQPTLKEPDLYETAFQGAIAEFWRSDFGIDAYYEVVTSPEDDIELRHISITNRTGRRRTIELTSYVEAVLTSPAADVAHPAFGKLFIQTELLEDKRAIMCSRRPRSSEEKTPWMIHLMNMDASEAGEPSYESDRSRFIGRARTLSDPEAMHRSKLSGCFGPVLDPCASIRCSVVIDPGETARINFITGAAWSRQEATGLAEKYRDFRMAERVSDLAWTHGQVVLQQLNATESEIQRYERLAGAVVYPVSTWRASRSIIASNRSGQSGLWAYGISGDLPVVLLKVGSQAGLDLIRQLLKAHAYWRTMGLSADLVIWDEDLGGYRQTLHDAIMGLISSSTEAGQLDRAGGVFVRRADQITDQGKVLIQSVASVIITDAWTLEDQLQARRRAEVQVPDLIPVRKAGVQAEPGEMPPSGIPPSGLIFYNGLGGFTADGREYIIRLSIGKSTPAPWSNVIANPGFGTVVSESGGSYTWSENSHEFRITPWYNDPVTDISGEAFYIRDEESGRFWSPSALPARGKTGYTCRHGLGYSVFEHSEDGIRSEMWVYISMSSPVKFHVLRLRNESGRHRRVSATGYFELVLGEVRARTMAHIITEVDPRSGAVFARNPYSTEFPDRVAFLDVNSPDRKVTGDRTEFLGRNGTLSRPAAMSRLGLSGRVGAALDPCIAAQVAFDLEAGQEREIVFVLGSGKDMGEARGLVQRFRGSGPARSELEAVWRYWNRTLGVIHVETPDEALSALTNGWLVYQVLACRLWARSGYYQSSGAFGFRDQIQDVMALLYAQPGLAREQILRSSSRQFTQGDVQHWWHPHSGRGVRTHISDDYLWLPWAVSRYVRITGDWGILDEMTGFLEGREVKPDEEAYYDLPVQSSESGTLYEHCVRAIRHGMRFGAHGLPLMGSGDWNDGMNLVGHKGLGESIWLAFFMCLVLERFAVVAQTRGDGPVAELCRAQASQLRRSVEESGWDGRWYLRAYFDDGRPLGSQSDPECQIDSISQSWSVLSGAGDGERARLAMEAAGERLVRKDGGLIQLLDPPFDKSDLEPGYIKGYLPGVRENGAQYTHAAAWAVMAFAEMGDAEKAWDLLSMINPINHSSTPEDVLRYRAEPYIMAADVYSTAPHIGRGGWTWYTGAAGWLYRLIVEVLLGLKKEGGRIRFEPRPPQSWQSFKIHYRHGETFYHIAVIRSGPGCDVISVTEDGQVRDGKVIDLKDDRRDHNVVVEIGGRSAATA